MAGDHLGRNRFSGLGQTDRLRRASRPGHMRDRHLSIPGPARRSPHHPRLASDPTTDRLHLAVDGRNLRMLAPTPRRLPLNTRFTVQPTRKNPSALESPPTERHRPNCQTRPPTISPYEPASTGVTPSTQPHEKSRLTSPKLHCGCEVRPPCPKSQHRTKDPRPARNHSAREIWTRTKHLRQQPNTHQTTTCHL